MIQTTDRSTEHDSDTDSERATPTDALLTGSLVVGPLVYLAADMTYAIKGWDDPAAATLHILGAVLYGLVVLRVALWVPRWSWLRAWLLLTAVAGAIGNAAYGFDAIHQSLGDSRLVDQTGAAAIIKPLGLLFPISLALVAWGLQRLGWRIPAAMALLAALAWPVAHIANIGPLAVAVNVILLLALGSVAWQERAEPSAVD